MDIRDSAVYPREILLDCTEEQIGFMNECSLQKMKGMQAYIAIRAGGNTAELFRRAVRQAEHVLPAHQPDA